MPSLGYSALKRFGEMLMRQSEKDPRLARAAAQGYDLLNPVVHGANNDKVATELPRAFYATSQPEHALQYTGGGRRGGIATPAKGGLLIPAVLKGKPFNTRMSVDDKVSYENLEWLKKLGITDPEAFRQRVWDINTERQLSTWPESTRRYLEDGMTFDTAFGNSIGVPGRGQYLRDFHEALNAIEPGLQESQPLLKFKHPYYDHQLSPKGRVMRSKDTLDGDAILVADPSLARSPWAEFSDDELGKPGLMKKRGGLVQYRDCGCK